jgi:type III pantothenate kinase
VYPFLALDVGNTTVKVGLHDGTRWTEVSRFASDRAGPEEWADRLGGVWMEHGVLAAAGLAAVSPRVAASVVAAVRRLGVVPVDVRGTMAIPPALAPFHVAYRTPETLGADRVAAAAAAFHRFGRPAARPVVALDAGTAVTLDVVTAGGAHLGGAILPGPDALIRALARGTAQLPEVPFELPPSPIGTTTAGSIQSGVAHLLVDGLAGLLARTAAALGGPPPLVVATGGWGPWLAGHLAVDAVEPPLVLEGVRLLCGGA